MTKRKWSPILGWFAAGGAATLLALSGPDERVLLGKLPDTAARRLDQQHVILPGEINASRTLAVVVFDREQGGEARRWVEGLRLRQDGISWVKMPVLKDPGNEQERQVIEQR